MNGENVDQTFVGKVVDLDHLSSLSAMTLRGVLPALEVDDTGVPTGDRLQRLTQAAEHMGPSAVAGNEEVSLNHSQSAQAA